MIYNKHFLHRNCGFKKPKR